MQHVVYVYIDSASLRAFVCKGRLTESSKLGPEEGRCLRSELDVVPTAGLMALVFVYGTNIH